MQIIRARCINVDIRLDYQVVANFASLLTAQSGRRERRAAPILSGAKVPTQKH